MSGSASTKSAKSLFDKLGGTKSIEAVVDEFYRRVLADTELKPFFAKTNMTATLVERTAFHLYETFNDLQALFFTVRTDGAICTSGS